MLACGLATDGLAQSLAAEAASHSDRAFKLIAHWLQNITTEGLQGGNMRLVRHIAYTLTLRRLALRHLLQSKVGTQVTKR
jgi:hypothetical protein